MIGLLGCVLRMPNSSFQKHKSLITYVISAAAGYVFMFAALLVVEHSPGLLFSTPSVIGFFAVLVYGEVRTTPLGRHVLNGFLSLLVWYVGVFFTFLLLRGAPGVEQAQGFFLFLFYPMSAPLGFILAMAGVIVGGTFGWLVRQTIEPDDDPERES